MTTKYKAKVLEKIVHEWDREKGQGDYLQSMGGYELGYFSTLTEAIEACSESIGYDGIIEKNFFDGGFLQLSVIENGEGYQDDNGAYLCDYFFLVEKHEISAITETEINKILG